MIRAGEVTDCNIIRRVRFGCWVTKATDTHCDDVYANAPQLRYKYIACLLLVRYVVSENMIVNNEFKRVERDLVVTCCSVDFYNASRLEILGQSMTHILSTDCHSSGIETGTSVIR
jgi:hypothetical protein